MKIPLRKIPNSNGINLFVLRLDNVHPTISGNKWYKLKYNLEEANRQKKDTLLTFGGAYSNHISATAAAGKEFGFKTIGIIRGDELSENENPTLRFAKECGMKLHFVSREEYRKLCISPNQLVNQSTNYYLLPEGGTNALAVKGCSEIISHINIPFDYICCPAGTGGTIAGIISSFKQNQKAIGFSVLKDGEFLKKEIQKLLASPPSPLLKERGGVRKDDGVRLSETEWELNTDYHFGGYAKHTSEFLKFISDFEKENQIPLEQVYTGKMMFGIYDLIKKKYFPKNSTIIAIHTGGLQGKLH